MLQKRDWAFLRQKIHLPLANNAHRHKVEQLNDGGPYRNLFFASVTYNNDLAPFQGASAGWAVPRVETLGFYEADDFVKTRWKFVSFYF